MSRSRIIFTAATAALLLVGQGCLPSTITLNCEEIAQKQCTACTDCEKPDERLDAASLCQLTEEQMADCEATLVEQCEALSSARQQPNEVLEECVEALDNLTCNDLYVASAQESSPTVIECRPFL
ncbi:MAG: hypothetical protein VYE40_11430 [Myxococcota bacterium]|jgi:hypothetical protein|nr:hypothetical protein [Myxococcota bacterium]MEC9441706.1 hypothetical protein [Myxococcota bacterium]